MRAGRRAILGLSFDFHDAAAALVVDGEVVAAAAEERFSRTKHDADLPLEAIRWAVESFDLGPSGLDEVAFYEKPLTVLERFIRTQAAVGPVGIPSLTSALAAWSRRKIWVGRRIADALRSLDVAVPPVSYCEHHRSHAAAAFYPSPFERSAVLTFDAVGEWASSSIGVGAGPELTLHETLEFPDSIGLFYSALTSFCGFGVNDGEFKLMGLAPYGTPRYVDALRSSVIRIADDGSIRLDQRWFDYRSGRSMFRSRLGEVLGGPPRRADEELTQRHADIACSAQRILDEVVLRSARHARRLTGERTLCLGGGVALNCTANARLLEAGVFDDVWVQPAAGDDGSAAGAALLAHHRTAVDRSPRSPDGMRGAALGPSYSNAEIEAWLVHTGVAFDVESDDDELCERVAGSLADGAIVGWFRGRMEFGPRALGHRSILADPRDPTVVEELNRRVKRRESFRPFAPSVLAEHAADWFVIDRPSPYMLFTAQVRPDRIDELPALDVPVGQRLGRVRSAIPACTHVDGSARLQTVDQRVSPEFHALIGAFHRRTGVPMLVNTSFNRRDEPIVRSPADALACAGAAGLDLLVLENCIVAPRGPAGPGALSGSRVDTVASR